MLTRFRGQYHPGFYILSSPESSINQDLDELSDQQKLELQEFMNELNYEIAESLKYKTRQMAHCRLKVKCKQFIGTYLINQYKINKARYRMVENFIEDHHIITYRRNSDRNIVQIKKNSFKMKYLLRKRLEYDRNTYISSNQMFICIEFFREPIIIDAK